MRNIWVLCPSLSFMNDDILHKRNSRPDEEQRHYYNVHDGSCTTNKFLESYHHFHSGLIILPCSVYYWENWKNALIFGSHRCRKRRRCQCSMREVWGSRWDPRGTRSASTPTVADRKAAARLFFIHLIAYLQCEHNLVKFDVIDYDKIEHEWHLHMLAVLLPLPDEEDAVAGNDHCQTHDGRVAWYRCVSGNQHYQNIEGSHH